MHHNDKNIDLDKESMRKRANRVLGFAGQRPPKPKKREFTRTSVRESEMVAHGILEHLRKGACADLARTVIDISASIDHDWIKMFQIFEEIDNYIKEQNCYLEVTPAGYHLRDCSGQLISQGATLRSWLASHARLHGDLEVEHYDRGEE